MKIDRLNVEEIAELLFPIQNRAYSQELERIPVDPAYIETEIINDDG